MRGLVAVILLFCAGGLAVTVGAQAVPTCPASVVITTVPKASVRAGSSVTLRIKVTNTNRKGSGDISGLNVALTLPDNFCASTPSTHSRFGPVVVRQNAYWLNVPLAARKSRRFTIKARIASLHPAGAVAVGAFIYTLNATGDPACVTTATNITVTIKALADRHTSKGKPSTNCTAVPSINTSGNYYLLADGQRLLFGTLIPPVRRQLSPSLSSLEEEAEERKLAGGSPTADQCYMDCLAFLQYAMPFYFSTSPHGCVCSQSSALIYDSPSTTYASSSSSPTEFIRINLTISGLFYEPSITETVLQEAIARSIMSGDSFAYPSNAITVRILAHDEDGGVGSSSSVGTQSFNSEGLQKPWIHGQANVGVVKGHKKAEIENAVSPDGLFLPNLGTELQRSGKMPDGGQFSYDFSVGPIFEVPQFYPGTSGHVCFAMDRSYSMSEAKGAWELQSMIVTTVVQSLGSKFYVSALSFSDTTTTLVSAEPVMYRNKLDWLEKPPLNGGTNIAEAISDCKGLASKHDMSNRVIVLLTDGEGKDPLREQNEAEKARREGYVVITVGVGGGVVGGKQLKKLSSSPRYNFILDQYINTVINVSPKIAAIVAADVKQCDIVVAGGSAAALGAALTAARANSAHKVCLFEPTDVVGGQLWWLPAIDFGTNTWMMKSDKYIPLYMPKDLCEYSLSSQDVDNNICWVSHRCYIPQHHIQPFFKTKLDELSNLEVIYTTCPFSVEKISSDKVITSVTAAKRTLRPGIKETENDRYSTDLQYWYSSVNKRKSKDMPEPKFTNSLIRFMPTAGHELIVIDATEFGDILVLSQAGFKQGIDDDVNNWWGKLDANGMPITEESAPKDQCGQAFTFQYFLQYNRDRPTATLPPEINGALDTNIPKSINPKIEAGVRRYKYRERWFVNDTGEGGVWTYRRVSGPAQDAWKKKFNDKDVILMNWETPHKPEKLVPERTVGEGNDYPFKYVYLPQHDIMQAVDNNLYWNGGVSESFLRAAEDYALGHAKFTIDYFDQNKNNPSTLGITSGAPVPGTISYLKASAGLNPAGTANGLSKVPYVRDSRRSIGYGVGGTEFTLTSDMMGLVKVQEGTYEKDDTAAFQFGDSVAIGQYAFDIHDMEMCGIKGISFTKQPRFYIPLRALTSKSYKHLLVAGKTMAQSYLANAATRVHPVEYASGVAAGVTATEILTDRDQTGNYIHSAHSLVDDCLNNDQIGTKCKNLRLNAQKYGPITWNGYNGNYCSHILSDTL